MAKKSKSYNPFYIPSLDQMKADATAEANAQVNASIAALPTDLQTNEQFNSTGHMIGGLDQSYVNFVRNLRLAHAGGPTDIAPTAIAGPSTGLASNAQAAARLSGIGFENQLANEAVGAQAGLTQHQIDNKSAALKALRDLAQQRATEKAKFGELYLNSLNQKKQNAFAAYQAFLQNQFNNSQLGAQVANQQANLDIAQQNANTRQQQANTQADKAAATAGNNPDNKTRSTGRTRVQSWLQNESDRTFTGPAKSEDWKEYSVRVQVGTDQNGAPIYKDYPPINAKVGTPLATLQQMAISLNKLNTLPNWSSIQNTLAIVPGKTYQKTIPGAVTKRTYNWLLRQGVNRMISYKWSRATATRLVKAWLRDLGIEAPIVPANPPPGAHGPGR